MSQSLTLSIPDTSAAANSLVKIPIRTTDVTGLGILSIVITLSFDQTVLDALGANSEETISQNWGNPLTTDEPGEIKLTMIGLSALEGEGILTYVFFEVTGVKDDTTTIHYKYVNINEGGIVADTVAGKFTALEGESAPNVRLEIPDSFGDAGSIIDLPIIVFNPSRINIDSLRITLTFNKYVLDALKIITTGTLTENWSDSIEVKLPGKLSLFLKGTPPLSDSGTLCLVQFQLKGSPGMSTPIHFHGLNLYNDTLKIGTIDGSIDITGGIGKEVTVSIPDMSADTSASVVIPVFISDVSNKFVNSVSIYLVFDDDVLSYQDYNLTNTLMDGWINSINVVPDTIKFGGFAATALNGQGILVEFEFKVIGQPGMQTALDFFKMVLNEGTPTVSASGGIFTVNYMIPVELISFNAVVKAKDVLLTWDTASECDNYGFEIERALHPNEWSTIGFAPGHGTTTLNHHYSFTDKNVKVGTYFYRLKQVDIDGKFNYSPIIELVVCPPKKFFLGQNYPNPFNPMTVIPFDLPQQANIKLILYNLLGAEVKIIASGIYKQGHHEVLFNATDLGVGLYFYRMEAEDFVDVKKLLILK